jgi:hypothetical protein
MRADAVDGNNADAPMKKTHLTTTVKNGTISRLSAVDAPFKMMETCRQCRMRGDHG